MAKIVPSNINISGKLGETVYVQGRNMKRHVRQAATAKSAKRIEALKEQNKKTASLNALAAEINSGMDQYSGRLKESQYYQRLQKLFRKTKSDKRFILLSALKGMEVNLRYPFFTMVQIETDVTVKRTCFEISLKVLHHPSKWGRPPLPDCYSFDVLLFTWGKEDEKGSHSCQYSEWLELEPAGLADLLFKFPRKKEVRHWMLAIKIEMGLQKEALDLLARKSMMIIDSGTLDKQEQLHLEKMRKEDLERKQNGSVKLKDETDRVKAKGFRKP